MSPHPVDPIHLTQTLVRCESVTPAEGGALNALEAILAPAGFACHRLPFETPGSYAVENLFARLGSEPPHLCFAGHTDVVPAGEPADWTHPPFAGEIADGWLYGRGAVDMKGNIAAFIAAALDWQAAAGSGRKGSISLLITGDEEADAIDGTAKVLDWMQRNGHAPDHCLVGEPSCTERIGDTIRIGRRGSLSVQIAIHGKQGHVGYAHLANNPVKGMVRLAHALSSVPLDAGTAHFVPSNLEVVSIDTGNPVYNVIPARIGAKINIRYNDRHSAKSLEAWVRSITEATLRDTGLTADLKFTGNADAFVTRPGPLVDCLTSVVQTLTGLTPSLSTAGGTSDARFIKDVCPVIEFGLVNQTIHAVDERVPVADLTALKALYRAFLDRYFETFSA